MIVSGAQTGVDLAALDTAHDDMSLVASGWVPRGRYNKAGPIPGRYRLWETSSRRYNQRIRFNVRDSDGTLILTQGRLAGGSLKTWLHARLVHRRPCLIVKLPVETDRIEAIYYWLRTQQIEVLNVAGPRESKCPGIYEEARAYLSSVFALVNEAPN